MSDIVTATATTAPAVSRRDTAPDIPLPNGKKLTPQSQVRRQNRCF